MRCLRSLRAEGGPSEDLREAEVDLEEGKTRVDASCGTGIREEDFLDFEL
jgi:hypothetical protein